LQIELQVKENNRSLSQSYHFLLRFLTIVFFGITIDTIVFAYCAFAMSMTASQKIEELKGKFSSLQTIERELGSLRAEAITEKDAKLQAYVAIEKEIDAGLVQLTSMTLDATLKQQLDQLRSDYVALKERLSQNYATELTTLKASIHTPAAPPPPKGFLGSARERVTETRTSSSTLGKTAIV